MLKNILIKFLLFLQFTAEWGHLCKMSSILCYVICFKLNLNLIISVIITNVERNVQTFAQFIPIFYYFFDYSEHFCYFYLN